jgi:polysaccharide biosynthesis protein PslH
MTSEQEAQGLRRATRIIAIQEQEAAFFRTLPAVPPTFTVGHLPQLNPMPSSNELSPILGFVGSNNRINQHAISWFVKQVWPQIFERVPNASLFVAGRVSDHVPPGPGIRIFGQLADLAPFYRQCHFMVNPIRAGTGLKIKTVEALGYGRCVLATKVGAEGLPLEENGPLILCETAQDFVDGAVHFLGDPDRLRVFEQKIPSYVARMNQQNRDNLAACLKETSEAGSHPIVENAVATGG